MKEYYISDGENKRGAFSLKDLKNEIVFPDTLIWKEGWAEWKTAKDAALIEPAIDLIINDTPPLPPKDQAQPQKKKKSLLKTIITVADGDIDDLADLIGEKAKNIEGKGNNRYKEQTNEEGWRGFLAARQNSQRAVFDMLFRPQLGESYFNRATFFSVMITLVSLKLFIDFSAYKRWWRGEMVSVPHDTIEGILQSVVAPFPFCVMDAFIVLIFFSGIYHLIEQKTRKKQGIVIDSDSRGISRFTTLGKHLKPEAPEFGATLFIEPLIAFVASLLLLTQHSLIFGIIALGAAGKFWYENYLLYQESLAKTPKGAATNTGQNAPVMSAPLANRAVGFASLADNLEQAPQEQAQKAGEKPSFTTMVYYAIGERLDKYLAENQDKVSSSPLLQKIQEGRIYFNGLNINQRKSANFFISSAVVFVMAFITFLINGEFLASFFAPFYVVMLWSAYLAFSQIKMLDKLINEGMTWAYLLGFGLIPVPIKNVLTGVVKFILFLGLAVWLPYVGLAYLIYRIVIPFLDFENLPSFEKA